MEPIVAICDTVPAYRLGLLAHLTAAGIAVLDPPDLAEWARMGRNRVLVLSDRYDAGWPLLRRIGKTARVVAIVTRFGLDVQRAAIRAGARSTVRWDAPLGNLTTAVLGAAAGQTVVDTAAVVDLSHPPDRGTVPVTAIQLMVLERLAQGHTGGQIAASLAISVRSLNRELAAICRRLGVGSRIEAVVCATRHGLI